MIHLYKLNNTDYKKNGDFTLHPISAKLHLILNGAWMADFQCPLDDAAAFILYKLNNTDYKKNGDFTLHPISAKLHLILNGAWMADFQCPLDDAAAFIENDCVIKFDLPHFADQLWVVTDPKQTDFDTIEFIAYPIFLWDAQKELIMRDCRPTNKNGQAALEYMLEGCNAPAKYQVRSDISKLSTAYAQKELIMRDCRPTNKNGQAALEYMLEGCNAPAKYQVRSDISKLSTAYYINKNFMEALNSSDENSFVNRWGGEAIFDNYTLHMNHWAGTDRGFVIGATKNISGFGISEDNSDFCNVIIPVGYNGWTSKREVRDESRSSRVLHKSFIQYDFIKWWEDASEEDYSDPEITICKTEEEMEDALTAAARRDFENGSYRTKYSYDVDFIDLRTYDTYKDFKDLEYVWLGDRVDVKNLDARITTKQVVTEIEYDLVEDEITRLILGSSVENFFSQSSITVDVKNLDARITTKQVVTEIEYDLVEDEITRLILGSSVENFFSQSSITTSTLKKIVDSGTNTVMANTIKGVIDMAEASLRAQKNASKRTDVRGMIYEDLMVGSATYGALCIGTQGLQISKQRNADNTDWIWGTAIDYRSIIADYIITGILSGKDGNFWLDLDTGAYRLGDNGVFEGTITTTKDAKIGIADYIITGILSGKDGNFWLDLDTGAYRLGDNGVFEGTITTTKDAKIGRKLFLDFDGNDEAMESGVYLGTEEGSENRPRLILQQYNSEKFKRKIGRKLFLDFDGNDEAMESGVYLGTEEGSENRPRLILQQYNSEKFKRIMLYTDNGYLKNGLFAIDYGDGGGASRLRSGDAAVSVEGNSNGNSTIAFVGKRLTVNDKNGNSGTGVTYSGSVSSVRTINGIVTGVTP